MRLGSGGGGGLGAPVWAARLGASAAGFGASAAGLGASAAGFGASAAGFGARRRLRRLGARRRASAGSGLARCLRRPAAGAGASARHRARASRRPSSPSRRAAGSAHRSSFCRSATFFSSSADARLRFLQRALARGGVVLARGLRAARAGLRRLGLRKAQLVAAAPAACGARASARCGRRPRAARLAPLRPSSARRRGGLRYSLNCAYCSFTSWLASSRSTVPTASAIRDVEDLAGAHQVDVAADERVLVGADRSRSASGSASRRAAGSAWRSRRACRRASLHRLSAARLLGRRLFCSGLRRRLLGLRCAVRRRRGASRSRAGVGCASAAGAGATAGAAVLRPRALLGSGCGGGCGAARRLFGIAGRGAARSPAGAAVFRRIEKERVFADQAARAPRQLDQQVEERLVDRLRGGDAQERTLVAALDAYAQAFSAGLTSMPAGAKLPARQARRQSALPRRAAARRSRFRRAAAARARTGR